jgi:KipI family sensor histidine kinase inhibitor
MIGLRIVPAGDAAVLVEMPARIDPSINARAVALARGMRERCGSRLRDVVVGYCSVTLYFDPLLVDLPALEAEIIAVDAAPPDDAPAAGRLIDVPVDYGGGDGPDLAAVATEARLSEDEVVALHAGVTYRVYMMGFVPGFAYMASVDPRIALPRRATPRTRVPAGSVAIAAGQTGIYPMETPGGWHLIGRTHVRPYDPARADPFLFRAGDQVRFRANPSELESERR